MCADKKITELTELTAVLEQSDILVMVDDPGGTPETKKYQKRNFMTRYHSIEPFSMKGSEDCETGNLKATFHIPPDVNGLDLVYVHAEVRTAGTTGTMDIMVRNETQSADMLSTILTIDSGETGSDTAATPAVIDTANDYVATNDMIQLDFDVIHTTPAKGCVVTLGFG